MKRLATVCLGLVALACSTTSTQLVKTWREPSYVRGEVKRVLVVGLSPTAKNQQAFEYAVAERLQQIGIQPFPAYDYLPRGKMADEETIAALVKRETIDLVLVTRLVTIRSEKEYVPGSYAPAPYYYGMYPYYSYGYATVYSPGYVTEAQAAYLETNAYEPQSKKLVWSGLTRTFDYSSVDSAVVSVAPTIVTALRDQGIL
jgi:hypothetical protein